MPFNQEKATASAAFLLRLRGGQMSYLKLIKLLYLADREALNRWGFNITTDRYVSMEHGPVVSNIYNLVTIDEKDSAFWSHYITPPLGTYEVALQSDEIPEMQLSRAEENLLAEIFAQYGTWDRWRLRDFTHSLPEWQDPGTSSLPISVREILKAQGQSDQEATDNLSDYRAAEKADCILGGRQF
jgi:uncharacterized phage-associated protein